MEVRRYERTKRCPFCAEEILAAAIKCKHCGSSLETSAAAPESAPPSSQQEQPSTWSRIAAVVGLTAIAIWYFNSSPTKPTAKPSTVALTPTPITVPASAITQTVTLSAPPEMPRTEASLIQIVSISQLASRSASNDMQKGGVKSRRDKAICSLMTNLAIKDWIGTIKKIDANSDGLGVLEVEIADNIELTTMNNELSDIGEHTLIDPNSKLFQIASSSTVGQLVMFSGNFFAGTSGDCLEEVSLTLDGKLREPEFVFKFSALSK